MSKLMGILRSPASDFYTPVVVEDQLRCTDLGEGAVIWTPAYYLRERVVLNPSKPRAFKVGMTITIKSVSKCGTWVVLALFDDEDGTPMVVYAHEKGVTPELKYYEDSLVKVVSVTTLMGHAVPVGHDKWPVDRVEPTTTMEWVSMHHETDQVTMNHHGDNT